MALAQVHRFREKVAIYLANGETVYLTPKEAKEVAKALNGAAKDIKQHSFSASEFRTVQIQISKEV
ncbi:hypothetical protein CNR37_00093 [Pseudomonas phage ventosus]|uniref:Uncharacterized protein n=1 Tax=Pseudomonas phage ventosus TaxID=2048980 RepID=A0A2H4P8C9_9CAUD|nr:hypothetical protein CNR37_00093 [Pseudomonas phage ventosus]